MRALLSSLVGVPATVLIAAGMGLAGVTVVSRVRGRREPPMRWRHSVLGLVVLALGLGLMLLDVAVVGVS